MVHGQLMRTVAAVTSGVALGWEHGGIMGLPGLFWILRGQGYSRISVFTSPDFWGFLLQYKALSP